MKLNHFNHEHKQIILDFEKEYNSFNCDNKFYKDRYYMAKKGAIRLKPSLINYTIHDEKLFVELSDKIRALHDLIFYREESKRKRIEAEEQEEGKQIIDYIKSLDEEELDISKIPFVFFMLTFYINLIL